MDTSRTHLRPLKGRDIAASLGPRAATLIGAGQEEDIDFACVAWIIPVSHKPSMVAFALRESSYTFSLLEKTGWCSINVPDKTLLNTLVYCGNNSGLTVNKQENIPHQAFAETDYFSDLQNKQSDVTDTRTIPVIIGARAVLIARISSIQDAGDHKLVCAYIQEAFSNFPLDNKGRIVAQEALLCLQHDLFTEGKKPFEV